MEFHGEFSMKIHGIPWNSMEVFHTGVLKQLARYTMKYKESDLHIGLCSSLTSANNNVGSCWPPMLRPF